MINNGGIMNITYLINRFERELILDCNEFPPQSSCQFEIDFNDLIDMVENPYPINEYTEKADLPYLIPFSHTFHLEGNPWEELETDSKDNEVSKIFRSYASSEYASKLELLFIDVDNKGEYKISMEEITNELRTNEIRFVLYSSFSHTPQHERFRVVLPLKETIRIDLFTSFPFKNALLKYMPFIDKETLKYVGYFSPADTKYYYHDYSDIGSDFSFNDEDFQKIYKEEVDKFNSSGTIPIGIKKQMRRKSGWNSSRRNVFNTKYKDRVEQYLSSRYIRDRGNGDSNNGLFNSIFACISVDDEKTLEEIIQKAKMENWSDSDIRKKIESARRYLGK